MTRLRVEETFGTMAYFRSCVFRMIWVCLLKRKPPRTEERWDEYFRAWEQENKELLDRIITPRDLARYNEPPDVIFASDARTDMEIAFAKRIYEEILKKDRTGEQ